MLINKMSGERVSIDWKIIQILKLSNKEKREKTNRCKERKMKDKIKKTKSHLKIFKMGLRFSKIILLRLLQKKEDLKMMRKKKNKLTIKE